MLTAVWDAAQAGTGQQRLVRLREAGERLRDSAAFYGLDEVTSQASALTEAAESLDEAACGEAVEGLLADLTGRPRHADRQSHRNSPARQQTSR
jgi:hypothetical protein